MSLLVQQEQEQKEKQEELLLDLESIEEYTLRRRRYNGKKVSEIFYEAVEQHVFQVKYVGRREIIDPEGNSLGIGYCAIGLLMDKYHFSISDINHVNTVFDQRYHAPLPYYNDTKGTTFKQFGDMFEAMGL